MEFVFTLPPAMVVQLVLAVLLPILVGLVTTRITTASMKSWLLAALTLVTSVVTQMANAISGHVSFDLGLALLAAIPAFAISVATYYGLWKPTGISAAAQRIQSTTIIDRDHL